MSKYVLIFILVFIFFLNIRFNNFFMSDSLFLESCINERVFMRQINEFVFRLVRQDKVIDLYALLPSKDSFSSISEWKEVFNEVSDKYPEMVEEIFVFLGRGDNENLGFKLKIPKKTFLKNEIQYKLIADYVSNVMLFNCFWWGAQKILISSNEELFELVSNNFSRYPYNSVLNFLSEVYRFELDNSKLDLKLVSESEMANVEVPFLSLDTLVFSMGTGLANGCMFKSEEEFDVSVGNTIGIDIGGSDVKIVYKKGAEVVFKKEYNWSPMSITDNSKFQHRDVISILVDFARLKVSLDEMEIVNQDIENLKEKIFEIENDPNTEIEFILKVIEKAKKLEIKLAEVDALGLSYASIVSDEMVLTRRDKLDSGLSEKIFDEKIANLKDYLSKKFKVGVSLINDGDAGALYISNGQGEPSNFLDELGKVRINMNPDSPKHSQLGISGVLQQYLSQSGVYYFASGLGMKNLIEIAEDLPKEQRETLLARNLEIVQNELRKGNIKAMKVFERLGMILGETIKYMYSFIPIKNIAVLGRVTKFGAGDVIVKTAQEILENKYDISKEQVTIYVPAGGEEVKRFGQAIGAAYLAGRLIEE